MVRARASHAALDSSETIAAGERMSASEKLVLSENVQMQNS